MSGGLLRCQHCGDAVVAVDTCTYGCVAKKDRGTCSGVRVPRKAADARLLTAVRDEVFDGSALQQVRRQVRELLDRAQHEADQMSRDAARRVIELEREVERLVDAIARVGVTDALAARLRRTESELDVVRRHAASSPAAAATVVKDSEIDAAFKGLKMRLAGSPCRAM